MLKLKRHNQGVWVDGPSGSRFKVRPATPKNYLELREKSKTGRSLVKGLDGLPQIIEDYDDAKMIWLLFDYILEDWEGVEVEGAQNKDEIKETIFNSHHRDFIFEKQREVFDLDKSEFEADLKNSKRSRSG